MMFHECSFISGSVFVQQTVWSAVGKITETSHLRASKEGRGGFPLMMQIFQTKPHTSWQCLTQKLVMAKVDILVYSVTYVCPTVHAVMSVNIYILSALSSSFLLMNFGWCSFQEVGRQTPKRRRNYNFSPSSSSHAAARKVWSLVTSAILESHTEESTNRLRAAPRDSMLLSAMARAQHQQTLQASRRNMDGVTMTTVG